MPMLALAAAALLHATDVDLDGEDEPTHHELAFTVDGGLSAGLPIAGWGGGAVRYEYRFDSGLFLGALGELSAGLGMLAPRANFLFGAHLVVENKFVPNQIDPRSTDPRTLGAHVDYRFFTKLPPGAKPSTGG